MIQATFEKFQNFSKVKNASFTEEIEINISELVNPKIENMLTAIHPKLPMRNKAATQAYYVNQLGFQKLGSADYPEYLMVKKEAIEIHFFLFENLDSTENYSGVYVRTDDIDGLYQQLLDNKVTIHPNGPLQAKPWGQKEFSLLDPNNNLLTFGQSL